LPYDRTLLTKALATIDGSKLGLRPSEFLSKADIDYKLNVKADKVDPKSKSVTLSTGEVIVSHYISKNP
jgi:NAD(P)H-nitrite reductase large subunit